jgi:hypothetical protein
LLLASFCWAAVHACAAPAHADVLTLKTGGAVEGDIVKQDESGYTVRTVLGTMHLSRDMVVSITPSATPFAEYEKRKSDVADRAKDHFELAEWCGERKLFSEQRRHLERSIELDPDFAPARTALGYVRVGSIWVDGRNGAQHQKRPDNAAAAGGRNSDDRDDEKVLQSLQNEWNRRIRAIQRTYLNSRLDRLIEDGRRRILEIRDPVAILPLAQNLGRGPLGQRELLVEALRAFEQDEATMNLAVIVLTDRYRSVREPALAELVERKDERVAAQFRKALASRNGELIRRAATGLAALERTEAVPDLIEVLTAQGRMLVDIPVRRLFHDMSADFEGKQTVDVGGRTIRLKPAVGLIDSGGTVQVEVEQQMREVTIYRTDVLEALRKLTGQDFGFDYSKWRLWYEENMQ